MSGPKASPNGGESGEDLGAIDAAYTEFHNHFDDFKNDPKAQETLRNSGYFPDVTDFTDPNQFTLIEKDYSQPRGSSPSDLFQGANNQFLNHYTDLMNAIGNWHPS